MTTRPAATPITDAIVESLTFDHRTLRAFVGGIAFCFPFVVTALARGFTSSISASYYTDARDIFVGALFTIGILLIAYKGFRPELDPKDVGWFWQWVGGLLNAVSRLWHGTTDYRVAGRRDEEDIVSTIGGVAAMLTALFSTACDGCDAGLSSWIHYISAVTLFLTVVYFCLTAFLRRVSEKLSLPTGLWPFLRALWSKTDLSPIHLPENARKVLRGRIYVICGLVILGTLVLALLAQTLLPAALRQAWYTTFAAEAVSLFFFGIAWTTACQKLGFLVDQNEKEKPVASGAAQPAGHIP